MNNFGGTRVIATILSIIGWLGIAGGLILLFSEDEAQFLALSGIVSGLVVVLMAQVVFVLLAIEKNTRPAETTKPVESAPDVLTM